MAITYFYYGLDPSQIRTGLHSEGSYLSAIGCNWGNFNNSRVDELMDDGERELGLAKRQEIYNEIQEIVLDELPAIYVTTKSRYGASSPGLIGAPPSAYLGRGSWENVYWASGDAEPGPLSVPEWVLPLGIGVVVVLAAATVAIYLKRRKPS